MSSRRYAVAVLAAIAVFVEGAEGRELSEKVLARAKEKGLAINPGSKEVDDAIAAFAPRRRAANIEAAKKFGAKNAEAIVAAYLKAQERWRGLSKNIGRDIAKMRDALMREVYDKLDYARL